MPQDRRLNVRARPQVAELRQQVHMLQAVVGYLPDADGEAGGGAGPVPGSEPGSDSDPARADAQGGAGAGADGNGGEGGRQAGLGFAGGKGLEALLLGKARRLEHDLTMARLRIAEACGASVWAASCPRACGTQLSACPL